MEKHIPVTGGCLCGAVRYESAEPPVDVAYCHCRMCQQSCGGTSFLGAFMPKAAFRFTRGEPKYYRSSACVERGFCADCGSPLIFRDLTDTHAIYVGTLDHPEDWPPTLCHLGMESRIPWDIIHDDLPQWSTDEDPEVNANRSEFEKLSRLLDEGEITQAEFERRREAMFGGA